MKTPTIAEMVINALKTIRAKLMFGLQELERILGKYKAHHWPVQRTRDGAYHKWDFPDGSVLRADIMAKGLVAIDA